MNKILGERIRSLREKSGLTQKQIAERLNCSRQKYARIEKGVIDISYSNISKIAGILGVDIEEITSAVNNDPQNCTMFRGNGEGDGFEFINEMLDVFYAHRKLYYSVRQGD